MLSDFLTPEVFKKGLQIYLKRHAYQNTVTADLWEALSDANKQVEGSKVSFTIRANEDIQNEDITKGVNDFEKRNIVFKLHQNGVDKKRFLSLFNPTVSPVMSGNSFISQNYCILQDL